ncbi:hypothetical protein [Variovorax sp. OV084]|uniref:hypothetical protein n=1 Tax=Variovorax sp. OV084 TaxID=1882777 RepID=UPI00115FF31B|nr:hypothetical protein [Variovorax sp. OV084]
MFVRALDEANQATAFTRLWAGVERLASPDHGNYEALVRRCAFLWNETPFHVQTLEHLREYRNSCVHSAADSASAKTHCYQLQQYFKALVHFHLRHGPKFATLGDANAFLDLPAEPERLDRLALNIQRARRFRAPARTAKPDQ